MATVKKPVKKKLTKAQDGGSYHQIVNKGEKRAAKRYLKDDVKSKVREIVAIDPENKAMHKKIGRQVLRDKKKTLRKYNMIEEPSRIEEGPDQFAKMKKGGTAKDKNWIQKAVNPKHKGYCTPMSKPTCTPKRKALARTFKAMAKNR
jgi:hypothetical protein